MVEALFDTTILVDALRQIPEAADELRRYRRHAISRITWIEVLAGTRAETREGTLNFLDRFEVIELDADIGRTAADLRQQMRIKLPDAIIWTTAQRRSLILVTRNSKDFPPGTPGVRIPYQLGQA